MIVSGEDVPDKEINSLPSSRREIRIVELSREFDDIEVELFFQTQKGEVSLNKLLLPKVSKGCPWRFIMLLGHRTLGCEYLNRNIKFPDSVMMTKGQASAHNYGRTQQSLIYVCNDIESHAFLRLDGAGLALLHEVGHAHVNQEIRAEYKRYLELLHQDVSKWNQQDYEDYQSLVIPIEQAAWNWALAKYQELKDQGIDLEPNLKEQDVQVHVDFAIDTYWQYLERYRKLSQNDD